MNQVIQIERLECIGFGDKQKYDLLISTDINYIGIGPLWFQSC